MTSAEFQNEMKRLVLTFGAENFSHERCKLIYEKVQEFDAKWLKDLVNKIILSNNPRLDFDEVAATERARRGSIERARQIAEASEALNESINLEALESILKKAGVSSLAELIEKQRHREL